MRCNFSTSPKRQIFQPRKRNKKSIFNRQIKIGNNRRRKGILSNEYGQLKMELH
jgi:hypothetical protein